MQIYLLKRKGQISKKKLKEGKQVMLSLHLVTYYGNNTKRNYEFLGLYLFEKPKNQLQKDHNRETIQLAEAIRAKRLLELQSNQYGFRSNAMSKKSFMAFFKQLAEKRREDSVSNYEKWMAVYKILNKYSGGKDIIMENINDEFLEGVKDYLLTEKASQRFVGRKLNKNSAASYFNIIKTAVNEAYKSRYLKENPSQRVKGIYGQETERQYLTLEELRKLAKTECVMPELKKAFLFSALTGLRWSDVNRLTWSQIRFDEQDGWSIHYIQKKTNKAEVLPISAQAIQILGERKEGDSFIITNLNYGSNMNNKLREWVQAAGIDKYISFHCARHTFATLQLTMDTDIYTVSKMLGHKHIRTTEVYAKVIDKKKIDAARRIPVI